MIKSKDQIREEKERLSRIKAFIMDMDGTIYLGDELFPFTKDFLDKVSQSDREVFYFTNNSSKNQKDYLNKLKRMDILCDERHMFLSTQVIIEYLMDNEKERNVYVVGTPSLVKSFVDAGFEIDEEDPSMVILGFDTTLTYEKLEKACRFIRHGAKYYGVNMDLNCPVENGEYIPDCGSMAKLIEASTGRYPEFFGKPSRHTLDYIIRHSGFKEEELCFVGDRIYTDIKVAIGTKALSVMVLSGETSLSDLEGYDYKPDVIVDDLKELITLL